MTETERKTWAENRDRDTILHTFIDRLSLTGDTQAEACIGTELAKCSLQDICDISADLSRVARLLKAASMDDFVLATMRLDELYEKHGTEVRFFLLYPFDL